jgi:uncharacterized protein YkwD
MRSRVLAAFSGVCLGLTLAGTGPAHADGPGRDVLAELNFARTRPADYARLLRAAERSQSADEAGWSQGDQDPEARDEAVDFLMRQRPLPPLREDARLDSAAEAHSAEQERTGGVGHGSQSGEGLSERLHRYGLWAGMAAEDISYGYVSPRQVVEQLIIDSGVQGRGHRQNIFDPTLQAAGVGCGRHSAYGAMCVIDFAGAIVQR